MLPSLEWLQHSPKPRSVTLEMEPDRSSDSSEQTLKIMENDRRPSFQLKRNNPPRPPLKTFRRLNMPLGVTYFLDVTNRYNQVLRFTSCLVNKLLKSYYPHSWRVSTVVNSRARIITAFKTLFCFEVLRRNWWQCEGSVSTSNRQEETDRAIPNFSVHLLW
jgi:hypothetical protein